MTTYRRIPHAAHYGYGHPDRGHDLEQWDFEYPKNERPADVPLDAAYHSGYRDKSGNQHWLYVRRAPLSPSPSLCPHCDAEDRREPLTDDTGCDV